VPGHGVLIGTLIFMTQPQGDIDFFISHRGARADWARWVNWVVRSAGFSTILMDDFPVGTMWTDQMRAAAQRCLRLIPLYSEDYWASGACRGEFDAYWHQHLQNSAARFLLPLVIEKCTVPDMHSALLAAQLYEQDRDAAYAAIVKVLGGITPVASVSFAETEPVFPRPAVAGVASAVTGPGFPASAVTIERDGFVDCVGAFAAFEAMLTQSPPIQITLLHGHGNQGKSTLLTALYHHCRTLLGGRSVARVEFKLGGPPPDERVRAIARSLGVAAAGAGNIDERVHALLDACRSRPTIILFDAYEHAELQHRHWINLILERTLDDTMLRCVVAGRELPPANSQPWGKLAKSVECDALKDKEAIVQHALASGYKGKPEEVAAFVAGFIRLRERAIMAGRHDHSISSQALLEELHNICSTGASLA
jgi:hypothetical protein